ncbi:cytochrome c oxidase subunit II [Chelatococcus sp. SYSU_G07232]|uniref:Cytochrome c oxidase subunit 2 n=1 Tax=Chelatococcus albus TaxID=3047466 RepID=A0ABT7AEQ7_9HYPH|nr:cytochrome c oxidase subunit II [Chelatococcus sp. SYSU_G07232]MDJ1157850.1 cytochrome c oxidase subunit II [Chelatococcus sp. SYSU_G07232]
MRIDFLRLRPLAALAAGAALTGGLAAFADQALAGTGQPSEWQMGLQTPVTEVAQYIGWFHNGLLWLIGAVVAFVLALLVYVMVRFNEKTNPTPSKTTHNSLIEVIWTVVPVLILVVIAVPSFRLLKLQLVPPKADVTIKATGHSWYWSYDYPQDQGGGFAFDANMVPEGQLKPGQPRLLATDNEVVLPVNKVVKVQVTSADVIHAFAVPSFGIKVDAVPGRLNETWFKAEREGIYYGQCSELCGQNHAFMPIAIRIVSEQQYAAWLEEAKKKFAANETSPVQVAARAALAD